MNDDDLQCNEVLDDSLFPDYYDDDGTPVSNAFCAIGKTYCPHDAKTFCIILNMYAQVSRLRIRTDEVQREDPSLFSEDEISATPSSRFTNATNTRETSRKRLFEASTSAEDDDEKRSRRERESPSLNF